jgi:subtilisin family serine protease
MIRHRAAAIFAASLSILISSPGPASTHGASQGAVRVDVPAEVRARATRDGHTRVIVELRVGDGRHVAEPHLAGAAAVAAQRRAIAAARARVSLTLGAASHRVVRNYETVPYVALDVSPAALAILENATADVTRVFDDALLRPVLGASAPFIQADQAWAAGYDGTGAVIAVLDTGVDASHPFLTGKVVEEACYSSTVAGTSSTVCPNGQDEQLGAGAAAPCPIGGCEHGTHVAGIAAGSGASAGQPFSGVAKGAQIMAVQVFSRILDASICGGAGPCTAAFSSDIIAGLERVYLTAPQRNIVAVNLSVGGRTFAAPCDDEPYKPAIDNLRAAGVASIAASGNSLATSMISSPACISSAISVGSVDTSDNVSLFSNVAPFLSLLAPGDAVTSSIPGGGFAVFGGTSMASPHVAGAWAIARQAAPAASIDAVLAAFRTTGRPVTDTRFFGGFVTTPRVRILQALGEFVTLVNPVPSVTAVAPTRVRGGAGAVTLTVTGANFNGLSVVRWNGSARPTTVLSSTSIQGVLSPADLATPGPQQVSVFTPAPGGGTSAALTVIVDPSPTLTVSAATVPAGSPVSVTLENGLGGPTDWIALARTGSADTSYVQYTYVGGGLTTRTWTLNAPSAGTYEFRLFLNNGFTRAATSPPLTVETVPNPVPVLTSISPSRAPIGSAGFSLSVGGTGFAPTSVVRWNGANRATTFVSATQLRASIPADDLSATGLAQVSVFSPEPAGGVSSALPFTITPSASLTVSATSVQSGDAVTVTLTNGPGGPGDWIALATTSASNFSYVQYTYVGGGVTSRTWTVTMPATGGTYEFRLFLDNGFTRAATSPPIIVTSRPNPVPALTALSPARSLAGSAPFTLTVTGAGFTNASVIRWNGSPRSTTFVTATQLRATIPETDAAVAGTAQVSVSSPAPGGGTSNALPFVIQAAPILTVSTTSAAPGANVTVTLRDGLGGAYDWLALAPAGAPSTSYATYTYVGAGVTTRTWTVAMPIAPGTYEFRLFLNNGFTRAATSPSVTVGQ